MALAAFAAMCGLRIVRAGARRQRSHTDYRFTVLDDGRWETLPVAFVNSEAARFDDAVRRLKLLCAEDLPAAPGIATDSLPLAAFALVRGVPVATAGSRPEGHRTLYTVTFTTDRPRWEALARAFPASEAARFDDAVREIKRMCQRGTP